MTEDGAELFGIPERVAVAAGCGDATSCFLGTGAVAKGIAVDVAGTASVLALAAINRYEGFLAVEIDFLHPDYKNNEDKAVAESIKELKRIARAVEKK